jgi:hypothetical protein
MNFDQWMQEISRGTFIPRGVEDSNFFNRINRLIEEELEEDDPPSSELKKK